jgi:microcystin-dependent protein
MSDPFVAEIRIFAGNFAPTGWALCDGQLLPISQNTALFSLLGTFYGGDGKSTFALPNLQGSSPMHQGQGQGLSERFLGEQSGSPTVTLIESELPSHTHLFQARTSLGTQTSPANNISAGNSTARQWVPVASQGAPQQFAVNAIRVAGGSLPHNNLPPYLVLTFIIAMQGVFPPRG